MFKQSISSLLILILLIGSAPLSARADLKETPKNSKEVLKMLLSMGSAEYLKSQGLTLISNVDSKLISKTSTPEHLKDGVTVAYTSSEFSDLSGQRTLAIQYLPNVDSKGAITLQIKGAALNPSSGIVEPAFEGQNGFGTLIDLETAKGVEEAKNFIESSETAIVSKWKSENTMGSRFKLKSMSSFLASAFSQLLPSANATERSCRMLVFLTLIMGVLPFMAYVKTKNTGWLVFSVIFGGFFAIGAVDGCLLRDE